MAMSMTMVLGSTLSPEVTTGGHRDGPEHDHSCGEHTQPRGDDGGTGTAMSTTTAGRQGFRGTLTLSPLAPGRPAAPRSPGIPCRPGGPWPPGAPGAPASPWARETETGRQREPSAQQGPPRLQPQRGTPWDQPQQKGAKPNPPPHLHQHPKSPPSPGCPQPGAADLAPTLAPSLPGAPLAPRGPWGPGGPWTPRSPGKPLSPWRGEVGEGPRPSAGGWAPGGAGSRLGWERGSTHPGTGGTGGTGVSGDTLCGTERAQGQHGKG